MGSLNQSRDLWDPRSVLDVDPMDPDCQCVGEASTTGRRCRWDFRSEQFNASQKAAAAKQLNSMAQTHPSEVTSAALESLARNTLCRDWHKGQAYATSRRWKAALETYARQHGERIDVRQLQFELDEGEQLRGSIARERDAAEQEAKATRQALEKMQFDLDDGKQLRGSIARERDVAEQEVKATRQALEKMQFDLDDGKQLRGSIARERDTAEQEAKATRHALETSQTRCAELMEKIDRSDSQRKEDQAANSRGVARLRQQLTELRTSVKTLDQQLAASDREVAILKEAKAVEEGKTKMGEREAEGLRQEVRENKARYEALQAESTRDTRRLEELLEAEREVGSDLVRRRERWSEMTDHVEQDKMSPPPPQKVKKGFFALILRQPPRILVRKVSRMMKTESVPYVQSAA